MSNQDYKMLEQCTKKTVTDLFNAVNEKCEYPMDRDVIAALKKLKNLIGSSEDDYEIFRYRDEADRLWIMLLEKAIKCLRYYDEREPFKEKSDEKKPKAYGIEDIKNYYKKYGEFEQVLYGSSRYYRDHVIHVLRTWLSGIGLLTKNRGEYLRNISIKEKNISPNINNVEKISMWTIIALTHDLGYPLEKAKGIIGVTQNMLATFITNPDVSVDFAFHGVQNYMNDYIVRLMSSKMEESRLPAHRDVDDDENLKDRKKKKYYVARLQSKYYFKFQKSLERNSHGILSTLIIYKLLTYFLESDYSINEDYYFNDEECRQFYIRREILRAIASHTCNEVYQMYMGSFSFLLRVCDDTQEWGRKNISELYVKSKQRYELKDIEIVFGDNDQGNTCTVQEEITVQNSEDAVSLIQRFREQALVYVTIFRDGQDTSRRDFSFKRILTIKTSDNVEIKVLLNVDREKASQLSGELMYISDGDKNSAFGQKFYQALAEDCQWKICDNKGEKLLQNGTDIKEDDELTNAASWKKGEFTILLMN